MDLVLGTDGQAAAGPEGQLRRVGRPRRGPCDPGASRSLHAEGGGRRRLVHRLGPVDLDQAVAVDLARTGCEAPRESWTTTRITVSVELNPLGVHVTIWGFVGPAAKDLMAWLAPPPKE